MTGSVLLAASIALFALQETARPITIHGVVLDGSGASVAGATIVAIDAAGAAPVMSSADGRFTMVVPDGSSVVLTVKAAGFAEATVTVGDVARRVEVVLQPAGLQESVSVTATRGSGDLVSPASTTTMSSADLATAGAGAVDDVLRATPGFALTRRSSSRVANPSSQGVSIRGLPGNAGSRTLVMADGMALNDAFGGWVYWNRIPEAAIERVEIVRGAAGDLYGGDAISGVIQLFTFQPAHSAARATFDTGSAGTSRASVFGAYVRNRWRASTSGEWVDTDGVPVVAAAERGAVDVNATSRYRTGFVSAGYDGPRWRAHLRGAAYVERRGNGTPLVVNRTDWRHVAGGLSGAVAGGAIEIRASAGRQDYYNNFSSVPAGRATERVTSEQWLPSRFETGTGQWSRILGPHLLLVGAEARRTWAEVQEYTFAIGGARTGPSITGGVETVSSVFARTVMAVTPRLSLVGGARVDVWRSSPRESQAPAHSARFFSPRISTSWQPHPVVTIRASLVRAYRTPTLDELHRSSQVGNTVMLANPQLDPEVLTGGDAAVLVTGPRASLRATVFVNRLADAIGNITLSTTPSRITRQKRNADSVRAHGLELEGDVRVSTALRLGASAVFTSSRYRDVTSLPAIEGHRVAQIPRYQAAATVTYTNPRLVTVAAQARAVGLQYEDDLNTLPLEPFHVVDLSVTRAIARGLQLYLAIENVFDEEIQTGRTPVTKIGWPRTARVGLRVVLP